MEEFPALRYRVVALFALGYLDFAFALVSFSPRCMGAACGVQRMDFRDACAPWFNSGYMFTGGFRRIPAFYTLR